MRIPIQTNFTSSPLSQAITEMRDRLSTTSKEAVTGRYSDLTSHLGGQIGKAMLGQKALDDITLQRSQLTIREGRLDIVQRSLTVIQEESSGIDVRLLTALGAGDEVAEGLAGRDAKAALKQIFSAMNVRHGDRYLFSGDATSTQPFSGIDTLLDDIGLIATTALDATDYATQIDAYFNDPAGPWQQTIYAGAASASDPDSVTGIDPAITELVMGLSTIALAADGNAPPLLDANNGIMETAAQTLSSAQTSITNLRAERGIFQEHIERAKESLDVEQTILTQTFNQLTGRDQYEAAAELKEIEANLEASYLLTSRLANLSLLNFLR